jgi:hypothetical protein
MRGKLRPSGRGRKAPSLADGSPWHSAVNMLFLSQHTTKFARCSPPLALPQCQSAVSVDRIVSLGELGWCVTQVGATSLN